MSRDLYVELHAKSAFSFLEGASLPEELAAHASQYDQPALALTDFAGVYGAPRFHAVARHLGIRALLGAEILLVNGSRLTVLVENQTGYQNLCRLLTGMKLRQGLQGKQTQAAATWDDVAEHATGLVCLTGDSEGPLAQALHRKRDLKEGLACVEQLLSLFGRHGVFLELQRHGLREQEHRNQAVYRIAATVSLPLLATNGVWYAEPAKRPLQDILTCIRQKTPLHKAGRLLAPNGERYLKTSQMMRALFADRPAALYHTVELAQRLRFTLGDLGYQFPHYPTPDGEPEIAFLRKRVAEGRLCRYGANHLKAERQIERELTLIEHLQLAGYFLTVWDIVRFCCEQNILVQGRGSAANSAVCYALGITAVDPVGMDLLFERFLSEERTEWPDIDLDLPSDTKREQVIQYLFTRYGKFGAAMTANVITYRSRSAIRDVGKALGLTDKDILQFSENLPRFEGHDRNHTLRRYFENDERGPDQRRTQQFLSLTEQILRLPRHLGQHSGGMVLCQGRLDSVVPLEPASMPGRVVVQWDKDDCSEMGLVKVDLLGLGMLAVLQDSIEIIRDEYGEAVDLAHLPQNDPVVYGTLQKADTIGMFQVESRAQQAILPRLKPESFYDLVVQVAIIRPGPIVGQMLHPYLRRRQGLEEPVSLHPLLDKVLERTLGVPLFQEQLLRMAMLVANFTGGEAEDLRRAMGFKRSEERMQKIEAKLRLGMTANSIEPENQERIIQAITSFALYGFPESHAASFALIAYASAYLKCRYLAAFTACLLNHQPMGFYSAATVVKDAQRHGQRFRPVDVQRSSVRCTIERDSETRFVRLGLNYVKGLSQGSAEALVLARASAGPFQSLVDLLRRVPGLNKKEVATLAELGALNSLPQRKGDQHRRGASWQVQAASQPAGPLLESLAGDGDDSPLTPMTPKQRIAADFAQSGLTIGSHPIAFHRGWLQTHGILTTAVACKQRHGAVVKIAGCVITRQKPETAKGFVFLSLEDETGILNVIVSPDLFKRYRQACLSPYVLVKGILQNTWTVISVKAGYLESLFSRNPG